MSSSRIHNNSTQNILECLACCCNATATIALEIDAINAHNSGDHRRERDDYLTAAFLNTSSGNDLVPRQH